MDVNNAFLHGDLQEEAYLMQLEGYQDDEHSHLFASCAKLCMA